MPYDTLSRYLGKKRQEEASRSGPVYCQICEDLASDRPEKMPGKGGPSLNERLVLRRVVIIAT
jgi:hypothetical protein